MTRRALVLAGGGYVASSWEIGIVAGLAERGIALDSADLLIGTSAGARVALDLASGKPIDTFYQHRVEAAPPSASTEARIDWTHIRAGVDEARRLGGSTAEILQRYGELAMAVAPVSGMDRHAIVAQQLPLQTWPERDILITALNARTGERRAFDRDSGIDLVDAVIASTSPLGTPPQMFEGQPYIDGGYHSSDNADLAIGAERVLILALRSPPGAMRLISIEAGVAALRKAGSEVEVIHPDGETLAALEATGGQMHPASGKPAAIAGRLQGLRSADDRLAAFWQ